MPHVTTLNAGHDDYVARLVATAPAPRPDQLARLTALLGPALPAPAEVIDTSRSRRRTSVCRRAA